MHHCERCSEPSGDRNRVFHCPLRMRRQVNRHKNCLNLKSRFRLLDYLDVAHWVLFLVLSLHPTLNVLGRPGSPPVVKNRPQIDVSHRAQWLPVLEMTLTDGAVKLSGSFAPKTHLGIFFRNQITKALKLPFAAELAMGPSLLDRVDLPEYPGSVDAST